MRKVAILIVDDSVTMRALMQQVMLRDPKLEIAGIASNVDEARTMMRSTSHDVVTLDLSMPGTGGLEFLDELRSRTHAPIVVVSSSTQKDSSVAAEALERGAFACFDKTKLLSDVTGFLRLLHGANTARKR